MQGNHFSDLKQSLWEVMIPHIQRQTPHPEHNKAGNSWKINNLSSFVLFEMMLPSLESPGVLEIR